MGRTCSGCTTWGFSRRMGIGTASSSAVAASGLRVPDVSRMLRTPAACSRCITTPADMHQNDMHGIVATDLSRLCTRARCLTHIGPWRGPSWSFMQAMEQMIWL